MYRRELLLAALLLAPPVVHGAGDAPIDRGTLRGLKALSVVIDNLDSQITEAGLTADVLSRQLESRLRYGGVLVDKSAVEFLGLHMTVARATRKGPYSLCMELGVYQPVVLTRDKNIKTATATWQVETVLIAQRSALMEGATDTLNELVDRYIAAWKSVNPE